MQFDLHWKKQKRLCNVLITEMLKSNECLEVMIAKGETLKVANEVQDRHPFDFSILLMNQILHSEMSDSGCNVSKT